MRGKRRKTDFSNGHSGIDNSDWQNLRLPLGSRPDSHTLDLDSYGIDVQNHTNKHFKLKHLGPTRSNIQQASSLLVKSHWQQEDPRGSCTTLKTGVTNSRTPALSQGPNVPHACMVLDKALL